MEKTEMDTLYEVYGKILTNITLIWDFLGKEHLPYIDRIWKQAEFIMQDQDKSLKKILEGLLQLDKEINGYIEMHSWK